ncbi:hypothetical protein [Staphylococcus borealis]|uniref:hypothetical protein n=1 Tax=Staphylococcus borealis TaxID=2742203 RepID=UPI00211C8EF5|nr:hypothetical protein [Staphylococcus borealis]MCQ9279606.1 hypothetical protein [Staphylococcus borealis]MDY4023318.1 hypothetical protein [Staphylococcus borealis]
MKRTFLLTYITTSGKNYTEFKTFQNGPDYDTCVQRLIDEFDELAYLFLKTGQQSYYINIDHIESLSIQEVVDGQEVMYDFED